MSEQSKAHVQYSKPPSPNINVVFVVSYVGTPFKGSQIQNHIHPFTTVEGLLLAALDKINLIDADILGRYENLKTLDKSSNNNNNNNNNKNKNKNSNANWEQFRAVPPQLGLGRTSRTDRGVSALCNVFNMYCRRSVYRSFASAEKLIEVANRAILDLSAEYFVHNESSDDGGDEAKKSKNPVLVIQAVQEVPKNFFGRFCANRRVYRYLIPAFALDPPRSKTLPPLPGSWTFGAVSSSADSSSSTSTRFERVFLTDEEKQQQEQDKQISFHDEAMSHFAARAAKANEILQKFLGFHRFHNFTGREIKSTTRMEESILTRDALHACDQEANRNILRVEVLPVPLFLKTPAPAPGNYSDDCYIPHYIFQIDGASFLLHMIRKIVGTTIAIVRGAREDLLDLALSPDKIVNTPMAPARYLCQTRVFFESFEQLQGHLFRERKLPLVSESIYAANKHMEQFETESIFAEMASLDATSKSLFLDAPPEESLDPGNVRSKEKQDLLLARQKKNQEQKSALETVSEMRRFVRMCALHNWAVADNPVQFRPKPTKAAASAAAAGTGAGSPSSSSSLLLLSGTETETNVATASDVKKPLRRPRKNDDDDNDNECDGADFSFDEGAEGMLMDSSSSSSSSDVGEVEGDEKPANNGERADKPTKERFRVPCKVVFDTKAGWLTVEDVVQRNAKVISSKVSEVK